MKNRSFILLALLSANDRLGEPAVHRTMLVKQAFLAETIRPLYRLWLKTFTFVRYNYGPYSDDFFHRLDTLIFSGLVEVTVMEKRAGQVEARYRITSAGNRLMEQFGKHEIVNLAMDLIWALQSLGVRQASTICKLVYQEAEFSKIFTHHIKEGISAATKVPLPVITDANNETFTEMATLQELQYTPGTDRSVVKPLPMREIVRLFLMSLALQVPSAQIQRNSAA